MLQIHHTKQSVPTVSFTWNYFHTLIKHLPRNKSPSPDGISNTAIQKMKGLTINRLFELMQAAIMFQYVPISCKHAAVTLISKGSKDPAKLENLRPISLLSNATRILETFLKEEIVQFVEDNKLLPDCQFGFRERLAAIQQVANLVLHAESYSKPRSLAVVAPLNIEKAYDNVWRLGLLHKLHQ